MPDREAILQALRAVQDPDLHQDIVALGFVQNLRCDGGRVAFDLVLTTPACPVKETLREQCVAAVGALPGVDGVDVTLSAQVRGAPAAEGRVMPGVANVVAVASGKGGVGKSTLAANLALALSSEGARVGLLDADIYGPSMPTMLGTNARPQPGAPGHIVPVEVQGIRLMSIGLLVDANAPMIWRGPMVHGALTQFLEQVEWGELDYVLVDMPPGTGDAQLTLTQRVPLAGAVIVTTPQEVSLIDARKGLKMFEQVKVPVLGVVENMSHFVCDGCGKQHEIFRRGGGQRTAQELGVPFLGEVPLSPAIPVGGDEGVPIVVRAPESPAGQAFLAIAREVARQLAVRQREAESAGALELNWQGG